VDGCGDVEGTGLSAFLTNLSRDDWTMAFSFSSYTGLFKKDGAKVKRIYS
jgi:hypothetical protein